MTNNAKSLGAPMNGGTELSNPPSATATYRTVKVGRRAMHTRYRAVVRSVDGSTSTIGKREYHDKEEAVAAAQAHIDTTRSE